VEHVFDGRGTLRVYHDPGRVARALREKRDHECGEGCWVGVTLASPPSARIPAQRAAGGPTITG
jgi:hypothetical protein